MACRLIGADPLPEPNADLSPIGPLVIKFDEILFEIQICEYNEKASENAALDIWVILFTILAMKLL